MTEQKYRKRKSEDRRSLIVHVLDRLSIGGMQTVALNVIEGTSARYRHRVICLRDVGILGEQLQETGVPVETMNKRPGKDLPAYWLLRRRLNKLDADIVHTYNNGAIDVAIWARMAGVKHVVHAEHGSSLVQPSVHMDKYILLRRILAPFIDTFVPVSSDLAQWLFNRVSIREDKICVIHNGVDTARYKPVGKRTSREQVRIGTVGRLDMVKAFNVLIDAFARLQQQCPERSLELIIIGDGPEREALERQVAKLALDSRVRLLGVRRDVKQLLQTLDIYVCSSVSEGMPLTILEAMSTGLPIVATRVGGNVELVTHQRTGLLVEPSDSLALTEAMRELVLMPERACAFGAAGRRQVCRRFSIDTMVAGYAEIYDRLLAQ